MSGLATPETGAANAAHQERTRSGHKKRKICELGTGEMVHVLHFRAAEGKIQEFEVFVQEIAHGLYHMETGISDVRVVHPRCGEVCFILTFLSREDLEKFREGPEKDALAALGAVIEGGRQTFSTTGTLMPDTHTLHTLLAYLKANIKGSSHEGHDVQAIGLELSKWWVHVHLCNGCPCLCFMHLYVRWPRPNLGPGLATCRSDATRNRYPRADEYQQYIHWDTDPTKYTRNLIFSNEHMDVLLMCWPPHCKSAIHSHENSSCWVSIVEGSVVEVQFTTPKLDKKFIAEEMKNPTGAVGRCSKLRVINEAALSEDGITSTYANDDIGVHRIENRSDTPAYTLHVYGE